MHTRIGKRVRVHWPLRVGVQSATAVNRARGVKRSTSSDYYKGRAYVSCRGVYGVGQGRCIFLQIDMRALSCTSRLPAIAWGGATLSQSF